MDISFKEKSAWGLLVGLVGVSIFYFPIALRLVASTDNSRGLISVSIVGVVALAVVESIYHAIVATTSKDASFQDERDHLIDLKAERIAGFVLAFTLFWIVGRIVATTAIPSLTEPGILMVAVWLLGALTLSEIVKLVVVIWRYRADA